MGRPSLRSYLTADMEATRKGKACTAVQNNTTAENIVNSCPLVLSLVSETEKIGAMIDHDRQPRVWLSLYLLFVMKRMARFCSFDTRSNSKPQFVIPNWRCERIKESYINFMGEKGKYRFTLFITPNVRDILLAYFCVWVAFDTFVHCLS